MAYELPEYELRVNAVELGVLMALVHPRKDEFPALYAKLSAIADTFYEKEQSNVPT